MAANSPSSTGSNVNRRAWHREVATTSPERTGRGRTGAGSDRAADLLAEAERPGRRFDIVICESIDRMARHVLSPGCPDETPLSVRDKDFYSSERTRVTPARSGLSPAVQTSRWRPGGVIHEYRQVA